MSGGAPRIIDVVEQDKRDKGYIAWTAAALGGGSALATAIVLIVRNNSHDDGSKYVLTR